MDSEQQRLKLKLDKDFAASAPVVGLLDLPRSVRRIIWNKAMASSDFIRDSSMASLSQVRSKG